MQLWLTASIVWNCVGSQFSAVVKFIISVELCLKPLFVMQELIDYRAKYLGPTPPPIMALGLSSRKNLCIHPTVAGEHHAMLLVSRTCSLRGCRKLHGQVQLPLTLYRHGYGHAANGTSGRAANVLQ
jgi:hypothetical protein